MKIDGRTIRNKSTYYFKDLKGQKFGHLVAIKPVGKTKHGNLVWECKCDCGNQINFSMSWTERWNERPG